MLKNPKIFFVFYVTALLFAACTTGGEPIMEVYKQVD